MVLAFPVVCQDLDDPALIYPTMRASGDHALQLGFQRHKAGDALLDLDKPLARDLIGRLTP